MSREKSERFELRLSKDEHEKLKSLASEHGITLSAVVCNFINFGFPSNPLSDALSINPGNFYSIPADLKLEKVGYKEIFRLISDGDFKKLQAFVKLREIVEYLS